MKSKSFDPLAYIENAFLDKEAAEKKADGKVPDELNVEPATDGEHLSGDLNGATEAPTRFRRTVMSAPRPRRARQAPKTDAISPQLQQTWEALPRNIDFLCSFFDDSVTSNYYRGNFKETRDQLVQRLLNPELSLEETSRLLGVCPATVRRYTNRGWLTHHRTQGGQRRFRLTDIVKFVEQHGRFPEE